MKQSKTGKNGAMILYSVCGEVGNLHVLCSAPPSRTVSHASKLVARKRLTCL